MSSDGSKSRRAILLSSAIVFAAIPLCGALAQTPTNSSPIWDFYGEVEVGGRIIFDRPPSGFGPAPAPSFWLTPQTTQSRAKFEEYGAIRNGIYSDFIHLGAATRDGQYFVDFWAENIARNNQYYSLNAAKVGEHYLMLEWNQIPHLISTSAKTIFSGAGTTFLSVSDALQTSLQANACGATTTGATPAGCVPATGQIARTNIEGFINNAATALTLGTQRDKGSVAYKFTPTDNLEFKVNYSHEHRTGTRPMAMNWGYGFKAATGFPTNIVEFPLPINDITQNVSAVAQYVGTTPWDTRWVANLRYSGSFYDNALKYIEAENPFCLTCSISAGNDRGPKLLRLALPPSNMANAFTFNSAVNLPWKSRWMGTFQYNMMRQNDPFVNTQTNGLVLPDALPATSANAKVDTILANNVLTTQLTNDLKSTLRYRYYDVNNNTPELLWGSYVRADSAIVTTDRRNLAIAYTKQNASGELNWRAMPWLNIGAIYAWEQYDRTRRDANVTNEHSGKLYTDATLWDHSKLRASIMYAVRRYRNYDAVVFVDDPGLGYSEVPAQVRKFDMANRNRLKAEAFLDMPVGTMFTLTPNFGLRFDNFPIDVVNQLGVKKDNAWNAGIEASAKLNSSALVRLSYNFEHHILSLDGTAVTPVIPANIWHSDITQRYHTFIAGLDWKAIPGKLDFKFDYMFVLSSEANNTIPCSSGIAGCTGSGVGVTTTQFPTERNTYHRFSVLARYFVDPDIVRKMGWGGEVVLKARYLFQRNRNSNWATDTMTPYIPSPDQTVDLTGGGRSIFLAAFNPNYTAHVMTMALAIKW